MYEYEVQNVHTGETSFMWGNNAETARCKSGYNVDTWRIVYCEKIED